ncbi:MAG: hypothetical protein IJZ19_14200 [Lentisphaeria bacterium]|nr:hypothetical protein [Lentisphaeria bacterium]
MAHIFSNNELALSVFNDLAEKMTGKRLERTGSTDIPDDLIVIGNESDNSYVANKMLDGSWEIPVYRTGSDDYFIHSYSENGRKVLVLGGGRPRAFLYAVYAYFEKIGCSYFWDGDIIPHKETLELDNFDILESPRFEYRGLRYFAHRSLHRFQAEHWTLEDWKKEIDWILKKRLNLFMLRIGQDDLFQKTFPGIVPYPKGDEPVSEEFARSYDNRTPFWSLQERGKLRKALLDYAFERDLLHPEDTGTMTHWYSRTPMEFVNAVKPEFVPQAASPHRGPTGLVWDIREDSNLENYFKLTQTHIDEYGSDKIFHTIGLAERDISHDRAENHRWKLYAYRRILERLRKSYPDAPLLIASWDLLNNSWTSEQVGELLDMLDPNNTLLFDYTSDSDIEDRNFTHWHCVGKFPWIFGIFLAFESGNDLRGNYPVIRKRLAIAKDDPFCKGMVIWPENSHSDTLMYEFFAANAWNADYLEIRDFIPVFCRKRYGKNAAWMQDLWFKALPILECGYWNFHQFYGEVFGKLRMISFPMIEEKVQGFLKEAERVKPALDIAAELLAELADRPLDDAMIRRDMIDIARTAGGRVFQYLYNILPAAYPDREKCREILDAMREVLHLLADLVKSSTEFSLCYTLDGLKEYLPVNPAFESALKANAENHYCRSYVAELFDGCYFKEFELYAKHALGAEMAAAEWEAVVDEFYNTPLENYRPDCKRYLTEFPGTCRKLSACIRKIR